LTGIRLAAFVVTLSAIQDSNSAGAISMFQVWFGWNRQTRKGRLEAQQKANLAKIREAEAREMTARIELEGAKKRLGGASGWFPGGNDAGRRATTVAPEGILGSCRGMLSGP